MKNQHVLTIISRLAAGLLICLAGLMISSLAVFAQAPTDSGDSKPKKPTPFIDRVVMFQRGSGGGNGEDKLPDIVLGPPKGGGKLEAGRDVLSLGEGGTITVEFVDNEVVDGPGPDFIVFENPFLAAPGNDPDFGFFELAKVEVSFDGETWTEFPYDTGSRKGCAGHHPVLANAEKNEIDPTDPKVAGGDQFDLKEIGVKVVRFVRITDVQSFGGDDGAAGFDLDAIAAVHSRPRPAEKKPASRQSSTKQQRE